MLAEAQRRDMLAAMGIDVYLLRTNGVGIASSIDTETAPSQTSVDQSTPGGAVLIVACAHGADPHSAHLRKALPLALGIAASRIVWIAPDASGALAVPQAAAYLALGAELARALGEQLSTMQQMSSVIAVADVPHACLGNGLARRALWQALKPIARYLRRSAG
jgi:hypothetical protein